MISKLFFKIYAAALSHTIQFASPGAIWKAVCQRYRNKEHLSPVIYTGKLNLGDSVDPSCGGMVQGDGHHFKKMTIFQLL